MVVLIQSHGRQCHSDGCMSVRREGEVTSQHNRTCTDFFFFTMQLVCPYVGLDTEFVAPAKIL